MHLGLEAGDQHVVQPGARQRPQADRVILIDRGAIGAPVRPAFAEDALAVELARVHRQRAGRLEAAGGRVPRAFRLVHAAALGHRALEHPGRQRRRAQRAPGVDVFLHHARHLQPAGLLPQLERALLHAKAPAHGLIDVARRLGDRLQVQRRVVKAVAQDRPQKAPLRPLGVAQQLQALGRGFLQHAAIDLVGLGAGGHVVAAGQVEAQHVAPDLLVKARLGLLPQVALVEQRLQHLGRLERRVERVGLGAELGLHRADDVRQRVQPHHVGGAEGAAGGAPEPLAGQVIDDVERQAVPLGLDHRREHAGDADAVGDEVGRVLGAHDVLAQRRGDEPLQRVEHVGARLWRGDQLHQRHVARRVEEVDAAKARPQFGRQRLGQLADRQARGVGGQDGMRGEVRRDASVELVLPVHALGNGLDDEVALAQQGQVLVVVGRPDQVGVVGHAERAGLHFFEVGDRLAGDGALVGAVFGQVEQHHRHLDVDQVRGDLRPHDAGAEHGDAFDGESGHDESLQWAGRVSSRAPRSACGR